MSDVNHKPATPLPFALVGYAVHTANAYPKLVEALRSSVADYFTEEDMRVARALLRDIGEAS